MNEEQLIKFIYYQGLSYEYSYFYETINDETLCCIVVNIYPWFSSGVIFIPCVARGHKAVFKLQGER